MMPEQRNDGKNTLKGMLVRIRDADSKASGLIHRRGFEDETGRLSLYQGTYHITL